MIKHIVLFQLKNPEKDIEKAKIMFEKSCENGYEKSCLERDKLD